jgi:opacity protein-like surface antigen
MRKTALAAAAACAVASGAMTIQASAADLDFMPPPAFVPTWQGFYVGGHVGYGEADFEGRADADFFDAQGVFLEGDTFRTTLSADGLLGGVQGGFNWQFNGLVFGIEGDVSFTDWSDSSVVFDEPLDEFGIPADAIGVASVDVDFLASIRGRLGMAFDNVMIYGTGGIAWADAEARARVDLDDGAVTETIFSEKESFDDMGFVVGGGLAWMVIPQTFSVGVEGLYYFFDQEETLFEGTFTDPETLESTEVRATASLDDAWVIRARADFHF